MEAWQTRQMQSLPYSAKKLHAIKVAQEFYNHYHGDVIVMVGGIDSLTLWYFLREYVDPNIPAASVISAEPKGNKDILKKEKNLIIVKPLKSKVQILEEEGFPVGSKEISKCIRLFQNPSDNNFIFRRACLTGITGKLTYQSLTKLAKKWYKFIDKSTLKEFILSQIEYFKNHEQSEFKYNNDKKGRSITKEEILDDLNKKLDYLETIETYPHIKISNKCCKYTKEDALNQYCKENGLKIYMGLMASEKGSRGKALLTNGCNMFDTNKPRSVPFRIFSKSDLLTLALELNVPVSSEYGEILETGIDENEDKIYKTTRATRTGCEMCGYGLELEQRPHRFDRMQMRDPREYDFWVNKKGWGEIMDILGVKHGNYVITLKDCIQTKLPI